MNLATADVAPLTDKVDSMSDRELLEAVYISNQTMIEQHRKMIELMQATLDGIAPLLKGLNGSPILKMMGVKLEMPGKEKADE